MGNTCFVFPYLSRFWPNSDQREVNIESRLSTTLAELSSCRLKMTSLQAESQATNTNNAIKLSVLLKKSENYASNITILEA